MARYAMSRRRRNVIALVFLLKNLYFDGVQ